MKNEEKCIIFITGNQHKFNEIHSLFQEYDLKYELKQRDLSPIECQADTIREIAVFKLHNIKDKIEDSFFVEDAGLFIEHPLKGFPGVYSSYVFKTIGNEGILRLIPDYKQSKAYFRAAIALYFKPLDDIFVFEGKVKGRISGLIRGKGGFGFDPIFIPSSVTNKTFAELTRKEKNELSHRGMAMNKLIKFLKENQ